MFLQMRWIVNAAPCAKVDNNCEWVYRRPALGAGDPCEYSTQETTGVRNDEQLINQSGTRPPQVSWDTYQFTIHLLDQHGNY